MAKLTNLHGWSREDVIFVHMAGNSLGSLIKLTTFGESHGPAIGGVLDGMPAGVSIHVEAVQEALNRRRPGQSSITTPRNEADQIEILSGVFEGKTTGYPIGFIIRNTNQHSADYSDLAKAYRPSHADFTTQAKFGHRDYRGGGRSSARETANWVAGGALAAHLLPEVKVIAWVEQLGQVQLEGEVDPLYIEQNLLRTGNSGSAEKMLAYLEEVRKTGDTVGGVIACSIIGVPAGWGQPVFQKLNAMLGHAMLSLNAVKGFELGRGFEATAMKGSVHNDAFNPDGSTQTNNSGGIQGGISNGEPIHFRVAFKPIATLMQGQTGLSEGGELVQLPGKGRHDATVLPRAVPIVEALSYLVLADAKMHHKLSQI